MFIGLACLLPLLETMHIIIKFLQQRYVFVCDYMATIKGVPRPTLWPLQLPQYMLHFICIQGLQGCFGL
jgi:hypothetical protein